MLVLCWIVGTKHKTEIDGQCHMYRCDVTCCLPFHVSASVLVVVVVIIIVIIVVFRRVGAVAATSVLALRQLQS